MLSDWRDGGKITAEGNSSRESWNTATFCWKAYQRSLQPLKTSQRVASGYSWIQQSRQRQPEWRSWTKAPVRGHGGAKLGQAGRDWWGWHLRLAGPRAPFHSLCHGPCQSCCKTTRKITFWSKDRACLILVNAKPLLKMMCTFLRVFFKLTKPQKGDILYCYFSWSKLISIPPKANVREWGRITRANGEGVAYVTPPKIFSYSFPTKPLGNLK